MASEGLVLLEDFPGTAKTTLAKVLARSIIFGTALRCLVRSLVCVFQVALGSEPVAQVSRLVHPGPAACCGRPPARQRLASGSQPEGCGFAPGWPFTAGFGVLLR